MVFLVAPKVRVKPATLKLRGQIRRRRNRPVRAPVGACAMGALAILLGVAGASPARALDKPRLTVAGSDVDSVNTAEAERPGFTAEIELPKPDPGAAVSKWNVVVFNFETQSIVWSQSNDGTPPARTAWNYRQKDGKLPATGVQLGLRATYVTAGGLTASPITPYTVTARHALFLAVRKKDFLFQPRGAIGYQRVSMLTKDGTAISKPFFPIVSTDVGLRLRQNINLRLVLDSANTSIARLSDRNFSSLTADGGFTLLGDERGVGSGLAVGARLIDLKCSLPEEDGTRIASNFRGGAATVAGWLELTSSVGVEVSGAAGIGGKGSRLVAAEAGPRIRVTENVDVLILFRGVVVKPDAKALAVPSQTDYAQAMFYLEIAL